MDTVTVENHNFEVSHSEGFRVITKDGNVAEYYEGDGVCIVNKNDIPHIEFAVNEEPVSIEISDKDILEKVLDSVYHVDEFKTVKKSFVEAATETDIDSATFIGAFRVAKTKNPNASNHMLEFERRVEDLDQKSKVARIIDVKTTFDESAEVKALVAEKFEVIGE